MFRCGIIQNSVFGLCVRGIREGFQVSRLLFLEELIDRMNIARWAESKSLLSEEDVIMNLEGHLRVQTAKMDSRSSKTIGKKITNEDIRHAFRKKYPP